MSGIESMIKNTILSDKATLLKILENSGQFDEHGLNMVSETITEHATNGSDAIWLTAYENNRPVGVAYCNPEPMTVNTWNLLLLWVEQGVEGKGLGSQLVDSVMAAVKNNAGRLLIVETSSTDDFIQSRAFYEKSGFKLQGTIADFFDAGDGKVIYSKHIV